MDATQRQTATSTKQTGALSRWFSIFPVGVPADSATLSSWMADSREMRAQASALAEKPPLLSY